MDEALVAKYGRLCGTLREMGSAVIGYSGGVDSARLAWVVRQVLGQKAVAVIARSPSLPGRELREALADRAGFRGYFCKSELFNHLERLRQELGFAWIAYGENGEDGLEGLSTFGCPATGRRNCSPW